MINSRLKEGLYNANNGPWLFEILSVEPWRARWVREGITTHSTGFTREEVEERGWVYIGLSKTKGFKSLYDRLTS